MDLLSQRYANPYILMDDFIRNQQLHDFTETIMQSIAEEKIHNARWEYYLHKVYDMSFEDYVKLCENSKKEKKGMSHEEISSVVNDSMNLLKGFQPK